MIYYMKKYLKDIIPKSRRFPEDFKCPSPSEAVDDYLEIFKNILSLTKLDLIVSGSNWLKKTEIGFDGVVQIKYLHNNTVGSISIPQAKYMDPKPIFDCLNTLLEKEQSDKQLYLTTEDFCHRVIFAEPKEIEKLKEIGYKITVKFK